MYLESFIRSRMLTGRYGQCLSSAIAEQYAWTPHQLWKSMWESFSQSANTVGEISWEDLRNKIYYLFQLVAARLHLNVSCFELFHCQLTDLQFACHTPLRGCCKISLQLNPGIKLCQSEIHSILTLDCAVQLDSMLIGKLIMVFQS